MSDAADRQMVASTRQHRFFVAASGGLLLITLVGFAPSFFLKFVFGHPGAIEQVAAIVPGGRGGTESSGLPLQAVAHGILGSAWMTLFFVQALLISSGRRALHQKLGVAGLLIGAAFAISTITSIFLALPRIIALSDPSDPSLVVAEHLPGFSGDLGSMVCFALAVAGAAYFRRRPDTHKQLVLLASMILITPGIVRIWQNAGVENVAFWLPVTENTLAVVLIAGAWYARRQGPWVLLGGFVFWVTVYSTMLGIGTMDAVQGWALGWITS